MEGMQKKKKKETHNFLKRDPQIRMLVMYRKLTLKKLNFSVLEKFKPKQWKYWTVRMEYKHGGYTSMV